MTTSIDQYDDEGRAAVRHCDCGYCGVDLVLVMYPTHEDVRRHAAAGHPRAIEDLARIEAAQG